VSAGRQTTLLVPVPEAEPLLGPHLAAWEPPRTSGIPAHVSVLYPFVSADEVDSRLLERLARLLSGHRPFDVVFVRTGRFPGESLVYLVPVPAAPFVSLTRAVWDAFPECPPYGGANDPIVPHLTAFRSPDAALLDRVEAELRAALPISSRAGEVWLMAEHAHGRWRERARLALG
jgi:2'-5' RNA ligase